MLNNKEQMRKWRNLEYNNSSKNQNPGEKQGYFGWTYHTREREFLCRIEMWAFLWAKEKNSRIKVWRYEKYEGWLMEPAPRRNMLQFAFHWDKKQWDKVVEKEVRSVMGGLLVLQGFELLCFHFHSFLCKFWFLFWFLLWFVGYSAACCSASICWNF